MGSIDRRAVATFSRANWDIPCPDNKVAGINYPSYLSAAQRALKKRGETDAESWKPLFLREAAANSEEGLYLVRPSAFSSARMQHKHSLVAETDLQLIHPDKGLLDCAHYVSKVLSQAGVTVSTDSAPTLQTLMQARSDTKTLAKLTDDLNARRILTSGIVNDGDLIFYGLKGHIHHSAVVLDQTKITCHTMSRHPTTWDNAFNLGATAGWRYTIVHFASDDTPPSGARTTDLPGWWTMLFDGRIYYYYFDHPSGHVIWTLKKPASAKARVTDIQGRGYWFDLNGEINICWTASGNMEKLTLGSKNDTLSGSQNDGAMPISGDKFL